jgi:hypothetical protein
MNCFRHPTEEAAAFCKGCATGLCLECCRKSFANQTHVCSEECARITRRRPAVEDRRRESLFDKVYAAVFIIVLLALLNGGISFWAISSAISNEEGSARSDAMQRRTHVIGTGYYCVKVFYALGLTDWKPQFGIGAAFGTVCALLYLGANRNRKSYRVV